MLKNIIPSLVNEAKTVYYVDNLIRALENLVILGEAYRKNESKIKDLLSSVKTCDYICGERDGHPNLDKYNDAVVSPITKNKDVLFSILNMYSDFDRYKMDSNKARNIIKDLVDATLLKLVS